MKAIAALLAKTARIPGGSPKCEGHGLNTSTRAFDTRGEGTEPLFALIAKFPYLLNEGDGRNA